MVFHSLRRELLQQIDIRFNKKPVSRSTVCRYVNLLGVLMDKNLSWKYISELTKKLSRTSGIFRSKVKRLLANDILKRNLYYFYFLFLFVLWLFNLGSFS